MLSKNCYLPPREPGSTDIVKKAITIKPAIDLPDDHWARRELLYWEGAFDRLRGEYLDAVRDLESWKTGHEKVVATLTDMERWYKSLQVEFETLKTAFASEDKAIVHLQSMLVEKDGLLEHWQAEHRKVVDKVHEWEAWYQSLQRELERVRQWDQDKQVEIQRLNSSLEATGLLLNHWKLEHGKVVEITRQLESWYHALERELDLYKTSYNEKQAENEQLTALVRRWESEHEKVVAQVRQWVVWYQEKQAESEQRDVLVQHWAAEHRKVEAEVHRWVGWYAEMRSEAERIQAEYTTLSEWHHRLMKNPFLYAKIFLGRLFTRS